MKQRRWGGNIRAQKEQEWRKRSEKWELEDEVKRLKEENARLEKKLQNTGVADLRNEWAAFKTGVQQYGQKQTRQAQMQQRQRLVEEIGQMMRPVEVAVVDETPEEWGTGRLGHEDFQPALMRPGRWFNR
jgi:hypothetical protein